MVNMDGNAQSKMTFGGYDLEAFAQPNSSLSFHSVVSEDSWDLSFDSVELMAQNGSFYSNFSMGKGMNVTIDSGTSFMVIAHRDAEILEKFFSSENGFTNFSDSELDFDDDGLATFNCSSETYHKIPDFVFLFDGV